MSSVNASRKPSPSVHSMGQQPTKFTNQVPHKTTRITRDSNETKSVTNNSQRGMSNESDFNRTNLNSRLHETNHAPVIKSSTKS